MPDLEYSIARVWNPDIRPIVEEAYRCYSTGASRACITLIWVAVCADILAKVERLAEGGDGLAEKVAVEIRAVREAASDSATVSRIQKLEREVLDTAKQLELIDGLEEQQLERLKYDRNLSVHPTFRPLNTRYSPTLEYARAHLALALDTLFTVAPSQGRRVVDQFASHVADSAFTASIEHIQATYYDSVRAAARRQIVQLAVKHATLELEVDEVVDKETLAERMAACVGAFSECDRQAVVDAFSGVMERFGAASGDLQLRTLVRLGTLNAFWDAVPMYLVNRLDDLVANLVTPLPFTQLEPVHAQALSLVGGMRARSRLSSLQARFESLSPVQKSQVISVRPGPYFTAYLPSILKDVRGYRAAELVAESAIVPAAQHISVVELADILTAWVENDQARQASRMPRLATQLFQITATRDFDHKSAWNSFLTNIASVEDSDSPYSYQGVRSEYEREYGEVMSSVAN